MSHAIQNNLETSWERLAYHPDGMVQKGLGFANDHKAATVVGTGVVGISSLAAIIKYRWLSRHGLPLGILAGTGYAAYLFLEESLQDFRHRENGSGVAKGIGAVASAATFVDLGSYYLKNSLRMDVPHIQAITKPLDILLRNKASVGGIMIAAVGLYTLGSSLFGAISGRPASIPYYRSFEEQPAKALVNTSKGVLGFLGMAGGVEILSRAQDWSFRPFTGLFGGKIGKTLALGAAVVVGLIGTGDSVRRTYGTNRGFLNDSFATAEQFGSGFGISAALMGLGVIHKIPALANIMEQRTGVGRWLPLSLGLFASGATFLKLTRNRWDSEDLTQNGWNMITGGLGTVLAVSGIYESRMLLVPSSAFYSRSLLGIGGVGTLGGAALFFARGYRSFRQGEVADGLSDTGLGIVAGAAGLSMWGEAFQLPYLDKLAEKIGRHMIRPAISGIAKNPIASGVAAIAVLAALYVARSQRKKEK